MKKAIYSLILLLLILHPLFSEDNSASISILRSMAKSTDPNQKMAALEGIEKSFDSINLSQDEQDEIMDILTFLACEGIVNLRFDEIRIDNDHSQVRNEANRLLGVSANPDAVEPLVTVLQNEPLTHVLTTAVQSAGSLKVNHKKLNAMFYLILCGKKERYVDEVLVMNTLLAIDEIRKEEGTILYSSKVIEGLEYVAKSSGGYGRNTRALAASILAEK